MACATLARSNNIIYLTRLTMNTRSLLRGRVFVIVIVAGVAYLSGTQNDPIISLRVR